MTTHPDATLSRRTVLAGLAGLGALTLAGCTTSGTARMATAVATPVPAFNCPTRRPAI